MSANGQAESASSSPFFVLRDPNSQKVFWGQLISQSCDKLLSVGMIWVLSTRFSPKWVPWFIALGALPHFVLALKSGDLIGRWGALRTVIWTDILRGILFVAIAAFMPVFKDDNVLLAILMGAAFVSNIAGALFNPAILSLPLDLMEEGENRDKLTALIDSCFSWGNVLGPLVSAISYAWVGLAGMLALNGLSYFISAALAWTIKIPLLIRKEEAKKEEISAPELPKSKTTQEILKSQPVISGMLFTFLFMNFFLAPLMIFMPWYAKNVYGEGIAALAKLEFSLGIGTVAGGLLLSLVKLPGATWKRVSISLLLMAVSYLEFTFCKNIWLGCFAVLMLGFFLSLANVVCLTFFQSTPEAEDVPKVMGLVNLISVASLPISMGVVGAIIERVLVPDFAAICAGLVIGIALLIPFIPGIKRV